MALVPLHAEVQVFSSAQVVAQESLLLYHLDAKVSGDGRELVSLPHCPLVVSKGDPAGEVVQCLLLARHDLGSEKGGGALPVHPPEENLHDDGERMMGQHEVVVSDEVASVGYEPVVVGQLLVRPPEEMQQVDV